MKAQLGGNSQAQKFYVNILLKVGEGTLPNDNGLSDVTRELGRVEDLIRLVYGDANQIPHQPNH